MKLVPLLPAGSLIAKPVGGAMLVSVPVLRWSALDATDSRTFVEDGGAWLLNLTPQPAPPKN